MCSHILKRGGGASETGAFQSGVPIVELQPTTEAYHLAKSLHSLQHQVKVFSTLLCIADPLQPVLS